MDALAPRRDSCADMVFTDWQPMPIFTGRSPSELALSTCKLYPKQIRDKFQELDNLKHATKLARELRKHLAKPSSERLPTVLLSRHARGMTFDSDATYTLSSGKPARKNRAPSPYPFRKDSATPRPLVSDKPSRKTRAPSPYPFRKASDTPRSLVSAKLSTVKESICTHVKHTASVAFSKTQATRKSLRS